MTLPEIHTKIVRVLRLQVENLLSNDLETFLQIQNIFKFSFKVQHHNAL